MGFYSSSQYLYVFSQSSTESVHYFYNQKKKLFLKGEKKTVPIWGNACDTRTSSWASGERPQKAFSRLFRVMSMFRIKNKTACAAVSQTNVKTKISEDIRTQPWVGVKMVKRLLRTSGYIWPSCDPTAGLPVLLHGTFPANTQRVTLRTHTTALFAI